VNECDDRETAERVGNPRSACRGVGERLGASTDAGDKRGTMSLDDLNSCQRGPCSVFFMVKAKLVMAPFGEEGGDVKPFLLPDGLTVSISRPAIKNVGVSITKGVVDLGQDGNDVSCLVLTEPETHWLEDIAQHSGQATQPNLPIGLGDSRVQELCFCPLQQGTSIAVVLSVD